MSDITKRRTKQKATRRRRKRYHIRKKVQGSAERPRLAVRKSLKYIYAQVIDDSAGTTLVQASSLESTLRSSSGGACNIDAAKAVGEALAQRAIDQGIKSVVFDRGHHVYHGKIQALADAAREKGLSF
jgi:large subunit ribosomal protein L18